MHVSLPLLVVDRGQPDLPEDNGPVRSRRAADLHEVVADGERDEVLVGHALRARPHLGLVQVPVVTGLEDLGLDLVLDDLEGLYGLLGGTMGRVQLNLFLGSCPATGT